MQSKRIKKDITKKAKQFRRYMSPYMKSGMRRNLRANTLYWPMLIAVLFVGMESKSERAAAWPEMIQLFGAGVLWALFIYLAMCIWRPRAKITKIAIFTGIALVGIEILKVVSTKMGIFTVQHMQFNVQAFTTIGCFSVGVLLGITTDKINFYLRLRPEKATPKRKQAAPRRAAQTKPVKSRAKA